MSAQPLSSDGANKKTAGMAPPQAPKPELEVSNLSDARSAAHDALEAGKALMRSVWALIRAAATSVMHHAHVLWVRMAPQLRRAGLTGIERAHAWRSKVAGRSRSVVTVAPDCVTVCFSPFTVMTALRLVVAVLAATL